MSTKKKVVPVRPPVRPIKGPDSSRALVLRALGRYDDNLVDDTGFATVVLHEEMSAMGWQGSQTGLSGLLRKMENDGIIRRDIPHNTKRCFGIEVLNPDLVEGFEPEKRKRKASGDQAALGSKVKPKANVPDTKPQVEDSELSEDEEIAMLLPVLVDQLGEERIIDILLERAMASGGVPQSEVDNRIAAIEAEWTEKLASVNRELEVVRSDAASLSRQYDEQGCRLGVLEEDLEANAKGWSATKKELAELQKTSDDLLSEAAKQIADLTKELQQRPLRPARGSGTDAAIVKSAIARRRGGPVKG